MTGEQKSVVIDVKMKSGEKWYALECDKSLRACTIPCGSSALHQGIGRGDEVLFTINGKDQFSYLKATGNKINLNEMPKPAGAIIDADKEQEKKKEPFIDVAGALGIPLPPPPKSESTRILHETHRSEIIMWEALLNTAVEIEMMQGHGMEDDIEKAVEITADKLHAFIMSKFVAE